LAVVFHYLYVNGSYKALHNLTNLGRGVSSFGFGVGGGGVLGRGTGDRACVGVEGSLFGSYTSEFSQEFCPIRAA
jgi:hypothetical protein